jgi:hypothetical protein
MSISKTTEGQSLKKSVLYPECGDILKQLEIENILKFTPLMEKTIE